MIRLPIAFFLLILFASFSLEKFRLTPVSALSSFFFTVLLYRRAMSVKETTGGFFIDEIKIY